MILKCLFLVGIYVSAVKSFNIPGFVNGKPLRHFLDNLLVPTSKANIFGCPAEDAWFFQKVDHFNSSDSRIFDQHYQQNNEFFDDETSNPIIFLMIGGEGTINKKWVCSEEYTYMQMAKQYNASVIQLEHRFFGHSYPVITSNGLGDMSVDALQLLTPQQALEDLANFIKTTNYKKNWVNPRWVIFGGSYPGSLCAWFRAQYPDLTVGGICSSAPLWAKVDFYEYAEVMEYALIDYSEKQNSNCSSNIKEAFSELKSMIYTDDGRDSLNAYFNVYCKTLSSITPPLNASTTTFDFEATTFTALVFLSLPNIFQYTFEIEYGIDKFCDIMDTPTLGAPVERLAEAYFLATKRSYFNNNYTELIAPYVRTSYNFLVDPLDRDEYSTMRGWSWLLCGTALGWLQTTESSRNIFKQMAPLQYRLQVCEDFFGSTINATYITRKVEESVYHFGNPWNYSATNVVLPNGGYDPWSALGSKIERPDQHQYAPLTHGAAHCSDMYSERTGEPVGLEDTRAIIKREVEYYLTNALTQSTTTTSPTTTTTTTPITTTNSRTTLSALNTSSTVNASTETQTAPTVSPATSSSSKIVIISLCTFFFMATFAF